jgi:hypothetical protein
MSAGTSNVGGWTKAVPEIDPALAISGLVMLLGGVAVLRVGAPDPTPAADMAACSWGGLFVDPE